MKTEKQPPKDFWIDTMSISKATKVMLDNQEESIFAVKKELPKINLVVSAIYKKLQKNSLSRLIYAGAGTSARIAVQDAAELYPTFGWPKNRIDFMIAGGFEAITSSVEGARRPSIRACARTVSISACAARGPGPHRTVSRTSGGAFMSSGRKARTKARIASTTPWPTGI